MIKWIIDWIKNAITLVVLLISIPFLLAMPGCIDEGLFLLALDWIPLVGPIAAGVIKAIDEDDDSDI